MKRQSTHVWGTKWTGKRGRGVGKCIGGMLSLGLLAGHALGGETTHVVSLPPHHALATSPTGPDHEQRWHGVLFAPGHDPTDGVLAGVTVVITHWSTVEYCYENLSAQGGRLVTWGRLHTAFLIQDPADDQRVLARHSASLGDYQIISGPGDGVMDWSGTGGHRSPVYTRLRTSRPQHALATRAHLNAWVQTVVPLKVVGRSQFLLNSQDAWYAFGLQHWSGGRVKITYHWN